MWYNIRTFPQKVASRFSTQDVLDYDSYKTNTSATWDNDLWELDKTDEILDNTSSEDFDNNEIMDTDDSLEQDKELADSFLWMSLNFAEMEPIKNLNNSNNKALSWYSKSDLLWIINTYIEENLDDDTDILVTVEYEDDSDPEKIILQTQPKSKNDSSSLNGSSITVNKQNKKTNNLTQKEVEDTEELFSALF